jgi:hypothetical protein
MQNAELINLPIKVTPYEGVRMTFILLIKSYEL